MATSKTGFGDPIQVRCPKCGAMPGRPCGDNRTGEKLDKHKEREEEARRRNRGRR